MSLIDFTQFEGFYAIPNLNDEVVNTFVTSEIERLEPMFLKSVFGYEFQKEMLLNSSDIRFESILSGSEYTDSNGDLQEWEGLNDAELGYVYYYILKDDLNGLTGIGFTAGNSENSTKVQAIDKPVNIFNKMVVSLERLKGFLIANESDYEDDHLIFNNFVKINSFGI
jgi:hypothetical protein